MEPRVYLMGLDPRPSGMVSVTGKWASWRDVTGEKPELSKARKTSLPSQNASALIYLLEVSY